MTGNLRLLNIEPTIFFVRHGEGLRQQVRLTVGNSGEAVSAALTIRAAGVDESLNLDSVGSGETVHEIHVPDLRTPAELTFGLHVAGEPQDERTVAWQPQKHWEIHIVHFSHHDMGYSDMPADLLVEHTGFMDDVLGFCEETAHWPEDTRFRYLVEAAWSLLPFVENRPKEAVERLAHFVRQGQIEIGALYGNQIQELCGHEEMVRLLYPSFRLKRELGIEITSAQHNDIPGFSWGMASTLAGAGIKYFFAALPAWYFVDVHPCWDEEDVLPIHRPGAHRWEGPDGQSVLYWHDPFDEDIWTPTSYQHALRELPGFLRGLEDKGYAYDMVYRPLVSGVRDNSPPTLRFAHIAREWNSHWAYPRLITANPTQFFERFEQRFGDQLQTLRGDLPGTDYPVCATCTPKETGLNRNTHDALVAAEQLATIAALTVDDYQHPRDALDEAYRQVLNYDEHCWGMWSPGGPAQAGCWSEKSGFAYRAAALTHDLTLKAGNRIVDQIELPDEGYTVTVFNPLSWERTDVVRASLRTWQPHGTPMHVVPPENEDEGHRLVLGGAIGRAIVDLPQEVVDNPFELVELDTGRRLPCQIVRTTDPQAAVPWAAEGVATGDMTELVFVAEALPPMGYRTYSIVPCDEWTRYDESAATDGVLENRFFRLEMDPERGVIRSLYDRDLGRELIDAEAPHGFGQLIIRDCGSGEEELGRPRGVSLVQDGPLFSTIQLQAEASCCPRVTVEITLYHTLKRVDFNARILRDSTPTREVFFAFPFQVAEPRFHFEAPNAVIEPIQDQLPGSNTDYHAVQHWAHVGNDDWGVTWSPVDAPMAEFGGLWPGYVSSAHHQARGPGDGHAFLQPGELTRAHIYSLVSYNNFNTNFVNSHACEYLVRYCFTAGAGDWRDAAARHFGWDVANPPLTVWMDGSQQGGSLPTSASFCEVDAANVMVLAFKRAEDGRGHILRLAETDGRETVVTVNLPFLAFQQVLETNLVEEDQRELPGGEHSVTVSIRAFAVTTLRLQ
ncbi:MAG: glycoside hydrolase family 38 C-terminal domain-containing protein [Candidatus Latescibacteria bacterium]|jgi:hypothetical protein|nr:hypothetical protein [Gemmatimonadaceae bacterium]MDP6017156.1 glycoside hydrolase family 38 C-terminal domain-containing protein [Candidatus Latescibacterota bacterium]